MASQDEILKKIMNILVDVCESHNNEIGADDNLIGEDAAISSRELVELLLAVEEFAEDDLEIDFDWSSDAAMSRKRSPFRTPRVMAEYLHDAQQDTVEP